MALQRLHFFDLQVSFLSGMLGHLSVLSSAFDDRANVLICMNLATESSSISRSRASDRDKSPLHSINSLSRSPLKYRTRSPITILGKLDESPQSW